MKELLKSKKESLKVSLIACAGLISCFLLGAGASESFIMIIMGLSFSLAYIFSFYKKRIDVRRWALLPLALGLIIAITSGLWVTVVFALMVITTTFAVSAKRLDEECAF